MIIIFLFGGLGVVFLIILMIIFLDDYESGNYRSIELVIIITYLICSLVSLIFLTESPRLLLS